MNTRRKYNIFSFWLRFLGFFLFSYLIFKVIDILEIYNSFRAVSWILNLFPFAFIFYFGYLAYKVECPNCTFRIGEGIPIAPKRWFSPYKCPNCDYDLTKED